MEKLKDDGVKKFAQAEIDGHINMKQNLKGLGFEYQVEGEDQPPDATSSVNQITRAHFIANGQPLPATMTTSLLIDHQVKSQCIATQKSEMAKLPPEAIDHRFIENQLDAHYYPV